MTKGTRKDTHRLKMAAKKAERANRQTGILHVAKQGPGIKTQEAITEWEPRQAQPKPNKAARLSQQQLAALEASAKQPLSRKPTIKQQKLIQPVEQTKTQSVKQHKGKVKPHAKKG